MLTPNKNKFINNRQVYESLSPSDFFQISFTNFSTPLRDKNQYDKENIAKDILLEIG
jgi:hypothetical protein